MNTKELLKERKAISPIIATLLLILIAIAAGVVVYAYVIGFVGNSTSNGGSTTDTLSIDQLTLKGSSATSMPVTAYVRNEGPSTESFNTGFYVKGSSLNDLLGPALVFSVSGGGTVTAITQTSSTALLTATGSNTMTVTATITCTSADTLSITGFGVSATSVSPSSCNGSGQAVTATITLPSGFVVSSSFAASPSPFPGTITGVANAVVGTTISAGTITVPVNSVATFTLAVSGYQANNPLTTGTTYTFQVTGTDGGSAVASAKAS